MHNLKDRFVGFGAYGFGSRDKRVLEEGFDRAVLYIGELDVLLFEKNCYAAMAGTEAIIRNVYTAHGALVYQASVRSVDWEHCTKAQYIEGQTFQDYQLSEFLRNGIIKVYKHKMDSCDFCNRYLSYSPTVGSFCIDCGGPRVAEWLDGSKSKALYSLRMNKERK